MPVDPARALGASLGTTEFAWTPDDVIVYHLGLGAGLPDPTDPAALAYTYERYLKVLPSFGVIPPQSVLAQLLDVPGIDIDFTQVLHGEQDLTLHRPLPAQGRATTSATVAEIWDKGAAALIVIEAATTIDGEAAVTNRFSIFARGEGGFGGDRGPSLGSQQPQGSPAHRLESPTLPHQATIYRLSGDKNPLHVDPEVAARAGFDRPILHGLATFGVVLKAVIDGIAGGDVAAVSRYRARFAGVVYPGETIVSDVWDLGDRWAVAAATAERLEPVLTNVEIFKAG